MDPCAYLSKWSCYAPGGDKRAGLLLWIRPLPSPSDIISLQEVQCMWDSEASGWFQSSGYRVKVFTGTNRSCGCAVSVTMTVVSSTAPFLWPVCRNPARKHFLDYVLGVVSPFSVQLEAHYSAQCRLQNCLPCDHRPLLKVIHVVVVNDQTCGLSGRSIEDSVSLLRDVKHYASTGSVLDPIGLNPMDTLWILHNVIFLIASVSSTDYSRQSVPVFSQHPTWVITPVNL